MGRTMPRGVLETWLAEALLSPHVASQWPWAKISAGSWGCEKGENEVRDFSWVRSGSDARSLLPTVHLARTQ